MTFQHHLDAKEFLLLCVWERDAASSMASLSEPEQMLRLGEEIEGLRERLLELENTFSGLPEN